MINNTLPFILHEAQRINTYWYLGSPYTKYPGGIEKAYEHVLFITGELIQAGVTVYSPIVHCHNVHLDDAVGTEYWLKNQRGMMLAAHGLIVAMMPGCRESFGLTKEIEFFTELDKPIRLLSKTVSNGELLLDRLQLRINHPEKVNEITELLVGNMSP